MMGDFLTHYLKLKSKTPESVSACILAPQWPGAPWEKLLQGMKKVKTYPLGYPLFHIEREEGKRYTPAIPWPVDIYLDATYTPVRAAGVSGEHLTMTLKGHVCGAPTTIALDSQASHCFIDKQFVTLNGIIRKPVH